MRPLEMSMRGFRSYRDLTTIDWRGRRLVGIVGPIGSGKSTILDAVVFSLFGKTPAVEQNTKSLIHQLSDGCHVELRFEVDGQVWRAVRALRRRGASGHQLERLAHDAPDAEVVDSFVGERVMRERVEELLGMDFAAFCRSVMLAQNRFSEFLRATPTQRNDVLKGVFGYERFDAAHVAARVRLATADQAAVTLRDERGRLAQAREQLAAAEAELASATARADALRAARVGMEELSRARGLAQEEVARAVERQRELTAVADALPDAEPAEAVLDAAARAGEVLRRAGRAAEEAEQERAATEADYAAVAERLSDQAELAALVRSLEHLARAADERARHHDDIVRAGDDALKASRGAEELAREAEERREVAGAELAEAEAGVVATQGRAHEARHADMAMALRADLGPGDPCPVCEQVVVEPPPVAQASTLVEAEAALAEARRLLERRADATGSATAAAATTQERASTAQGTVERMAAELGRAAEVLRSAEAELDVCKSELAERLGAGNPAALLTERAEELEAAERERARVAAASTSARAEVDRLRAQDEQARSAMTRLATELATAWGRLGASRPPAEDPEALRADRSALAETLEERREAIGRRLAEARAEDAEAAAAAAGILSQLGLGNEVDFAVVLAEAAAREAALRERVTGLQDLLAAGVDLDERVAAAERDVELTRRLASDLQPARFLAFLLEEERAVLGELGSVHLEDLTDGAYRFTGDDRFDVVDLNAAGSERRADSLSGGETFLASLALALALAEMVARGGGRLDAFFLDEGFGSLDPEHLDRAMEGIGRLVAGPAPGEGPSDAAHGAHRLVVLVSHVEQMRQVVEDLIVLDKDDLSGDTIVRSGAAPAWPGRL